MEPVDESDYYYRISRRRTTWYGAKYYTMRRLPKDGAERIPQKSIIRSLYIIQMRKYWDTLDPQDLDRAYRMSKYCR